MRQDIILIKMLSLRQNMTFLDRLTRFLQFPNQEMQLFQNHISCQTLIQKLHILILLITDMSPGLNISWELILSGKINYGWTYRKLKDEMKAFEFSSITELDQDEKTTMVTPNHKVITINIKDLVIKFAIIIAVVFVVSFVVDQIMRYYKSKIRKDRMKRTRFKKRSENKWKL